MDLGFLCLVTPFLHSPFLHCFIPLSLSLTFPSVMSVDKKSDDHDLPTGDHVEEIETIKLDNEVDQSALSSIEGTAASKAAWSISMVVSIGGLLFGE